MPFQKLFAHPARRLVSAFWNIASPYQRFRHAKVLHAVRVGLATATSILLTTGVHLPYGEWASISMLAVIGGLQHQANIRRKAFERAAGTMLGAFFGMLCIVQYSVIGSLPLTYALMAIGTGIAGYYAIGRAGYIALLAGITLCIVAGQGDNSVTIGLWRSANVLIGIGIALAFSFAFPLHALFTWRYELAQNMRGMVRVYRRLLRATPIDAQEHVAIFSELSGRLVRLRTPMDAVAKELHAPLSELEAIQSEHRAMLNSLELIVSSSPGRTGEHRLSVIRCFDEEGRQMCAVLLRLARALRTGDSNNLNVAAIPIAPRPAATEPVDPRTLPADMQGPYWVLRQLDSQVERMARLIAVAESHRSRRHPVNR
jgi:uncharacterized membrane protein YccC